MFTGLIKLSRAVEMEKISKVYPTNFRVSKLYALLIKIKDGVGRIERLTAKYPSSTAAAVGASGVGYGYYSRHRRRAADRLGPETAI